MAITIGKTATVVLNRFCNLVLKPEPVAIAAPADVTPNPTPDWANILFYDAFGDGTINKQQIQGIDTTITLNVSWTGSPVKLYYKVETTDPGYANGGFFNHASAYFGTMTQLTNSAGSTFTVSNNQYVLFVCFYDGGYADGVVTVKNQSDGNVVLDTFPWQVLFDDNPPI